MALKGDTSGLDTLHFGEPIIPRANSFTGNRKNTVVTSSSTFGFSKQRRKYKGNVGLYNAVFLLDTPAMIDYFRVFIERNIGKKFICHLSYDRPCVEPYVVQAVSDYVESDITSQFLEVSVTLEIYGTRAECLDVWLFDHYTCLGNDFYQTLYLSDKAIKKLPR